jgi:hypothetical protein
MSFVGIVADSALAVTAMPGDRTGGRAAVDGSGPSGALGEDRGGPPGARSSGQGRAAASAASRSSRSAAEYLSSATLPPGVRDTEVTGLPSLMVFAVCT